MSRRRGLLYFNARWYDPQLGRFVTEDPIRDGDLWVAYCDNNPLNATDPTGLDPNGMSYEEADARGWNSNQPSATALNIQNFITTAGNATSGIEIGTKAALPIGTTLLARGRSGVNVAKELIFDASTPGLSDVQGAAIRKISAEASRAGRSTLKAGVTIKNVASKTSRLSGPVSYALDVADVANVMSTDGYEAGLGKIVDKGFGYVAQTAIMAYAFPLGTINPAIPVTAGFVANQGAQFFSGAVQRPVTNRYVNEYLAVQSSLEKKYGAWAPLFTPRLGFGGW